MKNRLSVYRMFSRRNQALLAVAYGLAAATSSFATVLDDFNAAQRSGWQDADPGNFGLPGGQQSGGVFTFGLPPVGQAYFVSSTKVSQTFELKEGRTIEYRVDMINGKGPDSYAVMGFIPAVPGPNSLAGYGIAKSETDVLITKGISKYFIDDDTAPVKNNNVTLVLNLAVKSGSVYIKGQILDKDANNQVIWEKSFIDTPAADILGTGTDDPPAPYITSGNFVLYLYGDNGNDPGGYQVTFDNAEYFATDSSILDDFNAAQRSGWEDADPGNFGIPGGQQAGGVFTFGLPAVGQAYFVSSTKTTKTFSLDEGTRHEFAVDLISGKGQDSYAVMAFVPTVPGPNSLAGYGIAKSETDVLITKGISKYFIDDDTAPIKNSNVRLVLTLTVQNSSVKIRGQILDRDNNNQVVWDKSFIDTPAADILGTGTDDPPAPYVQKTGNVVLYLYGDNGTDPTGYQVVLDNLTVAEPPRAANVAPIISNVSPKDGAAFLTSPVTISFTATDDVALPDAGVLVVLDGTSYSSTNGLVLSGPTTSRTATLSSGTAANKNYTAKLIVTDAGGLSVTNTLYFDTFTSASRVVEIEDYNFSSGQYYNNPVPAAEGGMTDNSYVEQVGVEGVDYHDTRATPNGADTMYRSQDPVRMQHSLDQARAQYDPTAGIWGYDVGDVAADEWLNYTKDFAAGSYEVYLREAVVGFPEAETRLEKVTSDPTQPSQTVQLLGSFLGKLTGYTSRNVPLTDGSGLNKIVLRLSGKVTLRLRQVTADTTSSAQYQNYLIFVPVEGVAVQRPIISSLQPAANSTVTTVSPTIAAEIQNRDTSVNTNTIKLEVNGTTVSPIIAGTAGGATVTWAMTPLPASGALNNATLSFKDNEGVESVTPWSFTVAYNSIDPAWRVQGTGKDRGINTRVVQAQLGQNTDNSLTFAEELLRPGQTTYLVQYDTNIVSQVINFSQNGPGTAEGSFPDDELIPGLDPNYSTDDIAGEFTAYLELPAGKYRLGANTDDGYKVQALPTFTARDTAPIAFHNGGVANETYDFVITQAGLYPFRMIWYERGGGANVEWFQSSFTDTNRVLLNSDGAGTVKAFATVNVSTPPVFDAPVLKNGQLTIKWTGTGVLQESSDLKTWTDVPGQPTSPYTTPVGAAPGGKYYSIRQ